MPRKRHKKKAEINPSLPQTPAAPISTQAQRVIKKIASGGENYLRDNFERIMLASYDLADEPEFKEVTFPEEKTIRSTEKWMKKNQTRLERATEKGDEDLHQALDDVRIQIIDDILTPQLRKDVLTRLDNLTKRLMTGVDTNKLENALVLNPLLKMKKLPWGICGLILAIYDRSVKPTLEDASIMDEVFGDLLDDMEHNDNIDTILAATKESEKINAFTKKFESIPGLRERLEQQAENYAVDFENAIIRGEINLILFSKAEVELALNRFLKEFAPDQLDISKKPSEQVSNRFIEIIRESLVEIMTPERLQEMKTDLEKLSKKWLRSKNKWASGLMTEIYWLDDLEILENQFLLIVYTNQLKHFKGKST